MNNNFSVDGVVLSPAMAKVLRSIVFKPAPVDEIDLRTYAGLLKRNLAAEEGENLIITEKGKTIARSLAKLNASTAKATASAEPSNPEATADVNGDATAVRRTIEILREKRNGIDGAIGFLERLLA